MVGSSTGARDRVGRGTLVVIKEGDGAPVGVSAGPEDGSKVGI